MRTIRRTLSAALIAMLAVTMLGACTPKTETATTTTETPKPKPKPKPLVPAKVRIGTLPTEDCLPLWVAVNNGLHSKAGLTMEMVPFQSAQERDAAFTAGSIDAFMGDIIATAELSSGGFPARIVTVMLGATSAEGRFGIVSSPGSRIRDLKDVGDTPVGTSSGTIEEYVLDGLMRQAGVQADTVKKEELKKVPIRYQLLMSNGIKAAALPEPFLTMAIEDGAHLIADDTKGENLSQTVLVVSDGFLKKAEGKEAVNRLLGVWNQGVALVNANPNNYREVLVGNAVMKQAAAEAYTIGKYPKHALPTEAEVQAVLDWMGAKGLLNSGTVTYADITYDMYPPKKSATATGAVSPTAGASPATTGATP